jgi:putative phosphoribosyl transferase
MMVLTQDKTCYRDRQDAGDQLAVRLASYARNCVVFGIPKGGLEIACRVAARLNVPSDAVVVQKLLVPFSQEDGYGAVATDGAVLFHRPTVKRLRLNDKEIERQAEGARAEIHRRTELYRGDLPFPWLVGRTAVIVDDGMASGYTMAAAIKSIRNRRAGRVVVAVPVASEPAYQLVKSHADEVISLLVATGRWFSVSNFYENWRELSENDSLSLLKSNLAAQVSDT